MKNPPYDARAIANLLLDVADASGVAISNLALQKLMYFAHGLYLNERGKPLVTGYFEAWQYGPVHPVAYKAFKEAGATPIKFRAKGRNIVTGDETLISVPSDPAINQHIERVINSFGRMSAGRLVDLSHAPRSPWHFIVEKGKASVAFGLRISDDVIRERFKFHKVAVGEQPLSGEPCEDTPFA